MNTRTRVWSVVAVSALAVALRAAPESVDRRVHRAQNCVGAPAALNWESGDPFLVMGGFVDGTTGQAAAVQTRAAVLFEPERLHLVIECLEPAMDRLAATTAASGRDGEVFKDDCIEIFISPAGSEKEYYHLATNALGAQFDERVRERSWNPDWTVQATRLADRWRLQVSIPFAALGGAPVPGAVWWVNLCRQRQASGTLELSAWSPTGQDFHAVRNFGRLVFGTDYAACLRRVALAPVDERLPRLRQRAAIDAKAAAQLEAHLQAVEARLAPLRAAVATPGRPAAAEFAALLSQGYAALTALDDAAQSLDGAIASLECAAAMSRLAGPRAKLLAYAVPAITNRRLLPTPEPPAAVTRELALRACRGEYEPASFVVYALKEALTVEALASDLQGPGGTLPAAVVDLRTVTCWYQSGEGGRFPINRGLRVLTPELLLKDDSLVRVDAEAKENYVRLSFPDGTATWLWVSSTTTTAEEKDVSVTAQPIRDATVLQPVSVPRHTAKQFWVTVHVPETAAPGLYRGRIELRVGGRRAEALPLTLEVLPFELAPNPLESSIYFHWGIELDLQGGGTVNHAVRSVAQYRAELANLRAHGVDNPTLGVRYESGLLGLALWLRQEAGLKNDPLYYLIASAAAAPEQLKQILDVAKRFGTKEVYFYGQDEAQGDALKAQRPVWERVHQAGGKVFVAGSEGHNFPALGDLQDLLVCYGDPSKDEAARWHAKGHKIFSYANPQSGIEEPETYRRNFGLLLAANDYDGGMTYIFYHGWNDFSGTPYRMHNFVYPTADGLIDTIQWEGYREGIDDLRYLGTLRLAIKAATDAGGPAAATAQEAQRFLDTLDVTGDLEALRAQMIDWTRKLTPAAAQRAGR
jgi:hypothetical protein